MLVLRAGTGPGVGAGHLGRCLALAQAWRDLRGEAVLVADRLPVGWGSRFLDEGVDVLGADGADAVLGTADWCALDGYGLATTGTAWARRLGRHVLGIDDHGAAGFRGTDLTLDQNLPADGTRPSGTARGLVGPRYALLRRELRQRLAAGHADTSGRSRAVRLLVSLGGDPDDRVRSFADRVLADPRLSDFDVRRLEHVPDVGVEMESTDLALAAGGSTVWELCAFGVPSVIVVTAENQRSVTEPLGRTGGAVCVGDVGDAAVEPTIDELVALAADPARRRGMAETVRALVDGFGAVRVATRLRSELLDVRPAADGDARLLWQWANDETTRRWSFSTGPIPWEHHLDWFRGVLADPSRKLYVVSDRTGQAVGQIRFDGPEGERADSGDAVLSMSVAPGLRGYGHAGALVDAGVRRYFAESTTGSVVARVREGNHRSARAFVGADFDAGPSGGSDGRRWQSYTRSRMDSGRD